MLLKDAPRPWMLKGYWSLLGNYFFFIQLPWYSYYKSIFFRYDGIAASLPDSFSRLLERIRRLQLELGHLPQKWRVLWDKLELPTTDELAVCLQIFSFIPERLIIIYI